MKITEVEKWMERDLNPPPGYTPVLELLGRKRRIEAARAIAQENKIEISEDPQLAGKELLRLYWTSMIHE